MVNIARLQEVMDHIKANPEDHNQASFICETTACFAGHTVIMNGWIPKLLYPEDYREWGIKVEKDGRVSTIDDAAEELLDLDPAWSELLFFIAQSLSQVELVVNAIIAGQYFDDAKNDLFNLKDKERAAR